MRTTIILLLACLLLPIRGPAQSTVPWFAINSAFGISSSATSSVQSSLGNVSYGTTQGERTTVELGFVLDAFVTQYVLALHVVIDIKPGVSPDTVAPRSIGVIPVAILTTSAFDARTVDPLSVEFGPNKAKEIHRKGHLEDVNRDGKKDMVLHFNTQETGIQCGATQVSLTGRTVTGRSIAGNMAIVTVGCGLGKDVVAEEVPSAWGLEQNYPNPFNPTTTITVALPSEAYVTLEVYNTLGQKVAELVDGTLAAGYHHIVFDASRLSSGMYVYRLRAGEYVATKRLMLLK